jgi:predicted nucleotidyltransferase
VPAYRRSPVKKDHIRDCVNIALKEMRQLTEFEKVQFIILYGSAAEERMTGESDIDLCIYFAGDRARAAKFRHKVLSRLPGTRYDIQVFQNLPLYVRVEVLKGTPVFVRDTRFLYETATETIRDFSDFKHRLHDYTGQAAIR